MDRPAADRLSPRALARLLAPAEGRAEMTLRHVVVCLLTTLVTCTFGTPEAALSVYVVFFVIQRDRVASVLLPIALLLIVTPLMGLVLLVTVYSLDYPAWRLAAMAVLSIALLYLTSASKLRPVGAILAMIVGFSLDELGMVPVGEVATRMLLYAWLMAAIPVVLAVLAALTLAPSPRRLAGEALARRLAMASHGLRGGAADDLLPALSAGNGQILAWIKLAGLEGSADRADAAALAQAAASSTAILASVRLLGRTRALPDALAAPLADALDAMADMLRQGGYPADIRLDLPPAPGLDPLARAALDDLRGAITNFAEPPTPPPAQAARSGAGFFLPGAFSDPAHMAYALKTTGAAMFCYLLYMLLDWPGIHTCFITCYIVSLGTTAETVQKLSLRLAGCLIGALAGTAAMVWVLPSMDTLAALLLLVALATGASAWIAVGSPRISYAGFQMAFAFLLCVLQGPGPAFDLTLARDRSIGILLGNVVVFLVFTRIWPVSVATRIDRGLASLRAQWRAVAAGGPRRAALAAEAFAASTAIEQDLALLPYEPSWVRPDTAWRRDREHQLERLAAIGVPVYLAAGRPAARAGLLARLDDAPAPATQDPPGQALLHDIDLRRGGPRRAPPMESDRHAPA